MSVNPRYITAYEVATLSREVVQLIPTTRPSSPVEGMIYADSSDHHLYFFDGTQWELLTFSPGGGP